MMTKNHYTFKHKVCILLFLFTMTVNAQEQKVFNNLEEVLQAAKSYNHTFKNADLQTKLAKLTRETAWGNILNPRAPAYAQSLDNINQQVIFMPGEIFGQPGTFRQITTGKRYSTLINVQPQFDILNLSSIKQLKSAKINQELTEIKNKINEQEIYNQINSIYFNILSFKGQIKIIEQNLGLADTIFNITQNRFNESVGRKQDVNEAQVNMINLQDQLEQIKVNLKIQEHSLALFFENNIIPILADDISNYQNAAEKMQTKSTLQTQNANLQLQMLTQDIRVSKAQNFPVLSFVSSFNWQNLDSNGFFTDNSTWVDYSYLGLKLSMDFPTTISKLSTVKDKQFQRMMLKNNADYSAKEEELKNQQLVLEYDKSVSQLQNYKKIAVLKEDTYQKNFNQYQENILDLDKLLISHNDLLLAKLNLVNAMANIGFNKSRIDINNKF